jgi:hypothetical protein
MAALGGTAYLKVDGKQYDLHGNLTVYIGDSEQESVVGMDGVHGYTEKPTAPFLEGDLSDSAGLSIEELGAIRDASITVELNSGKVFSFQEAWVMKTPELSVADARMSVRFEAKRAQEIR